MDHNSHKLDSAEKEYRTRDDGSSSSGQGLHHSISQQSTAQHNILPWPAYEPQVLYNYKSSNGLGLNDNELAGMCFPHKVCVQYWS
jgi:hypothetical protein